MSSIGSVRFRILDSSEYLTVLQALTGAVQDGIEALASNRLQEFKEHLARQEDYCARLQDTMRRQAVADPNGPAFSLVPDDTRSGETIRTEHRRLSEMNRRYAALLRRSNRSIGLLASLSRSYLDDFDATGPHPSRRLEWHAEIG